MSDGKIEYDVRANTSNLDGDLQQATGAMEKHAGKWSSVVEGAKMKIGGMLTEMAANAASSAWELGTGFEKGLANISTLVDTTIVDMDKLGDNILALSADMGLSASSIEDAAYNAVSSYSKLSTDSAGLMDLLSKSSKLAVAGLTDIDTATQATLTVMNSYGVGLEAVDSIQKNLIQTQVYGKTTVNEIGQAIGAVAPIAANMGVGFDQLSAAIAAFTPTAGGTSEAANKLKSAFVELGKNGTIAANSLQAAAKGSKYAGMSFSEMMKSGASLNEIVDMLSSYAKKSNLQIVDLFGSVEAGQAITALATNNCEAFNTALAGMHTQADSVNDAYTKASDTIEMKFNQAMKSGETFVIKLFQAFQPLIEIVLSLVTIFLQVITNALEPFMTAIQPIIDILAKLGEKIKEVLSGTLTTVMGEATNLLGKAIETIISIFNRLFEAAQPMIQAIKDFASMIMNAIQTAIQPLQDEIQPGLTNVVESIISRFKDFVEMCQPVIEIVKSVALTIIECIASAIKPLAEAMGPVMETLGQLRDTFKQVFFESIVPVLQQAGETIKGIVQAVTNVFKGLCEFIAGIFTGNWQKAWSGVSNIFKGIWEGILGLLKNIANTIINTVNGMINTIGKGVNAIAGLFGGHVDMPQIPKFRSGLDYVPSDDFPALLHRGEAVLTSAEASAWRSGQGRGGGLSDSDCRSIAKYMAAELRNLQIPVYLDGRAVGKSVEPYVSTAQASRVESMQRSGFRG